MRKRFPISMEMFTREVRARADEGDGTERLELSCGHVMHVVTPVELNRVYCSQCLSNWLTDRRTQALLHQ